MQVQQISISEKGLSSPLHLDFSPDLILMFASSKIKKINDFANQVAEAYPNSIITGCSTSGEISDEIVSDLSVSLTAINFEKTEIMKAEAIIKSMEDSESAGKNIADQLNQKAGLNHIIVFSDGLNINGADLVNGLNSNIPDGINITGGLAGDGSDFQSTFVINNGQVTDKLIVGIGFYGEHLKVGCGSQGGWSSFGMERKVTKSTNNILYEIDDKPALELYKSFLKEEADNLPGSALLFPLSMRIKEGARPVVRTILGVNESDQSMTFAGNIPKDSYVRLMKANIDHLINGAEESANVAKKHIDVQAELAILISCVGRRLVLKQLVEEEIEAVKDSLGEQTQITGFYSYGEIAPFGQFSSCELHNQTMTITTFTEV